jgi:hypothetical protein
MGLGSEETMKTWKIKVCEFGLTGQSIRFLEVTARTKSSALKQAQKVQGNRDWDILEAKEKSQ